MFQLIPEFFRNILILESLQLDTILEHCKNMYKSKYPTPEEPALIDLKGVMSVAIWPLEYWNSGKLEWWGCKADGGLILFSGQCQFLKNRSQSCSLSKLLCVKFDLGTFAPFRSYIGGGHLWQAAKMGPILWFYKDIRLFIG